MTTSIPINGTPEEIKAWNWQRDAELWGEATADLQALPQKEMEAEIARWQKQFNTPDDLDWPAERFECMGNP